MSSNAFNVLLETSTQRYSQICFYNNLFFCCILYNIYYYIAYRCTHKSRKLFNPTNNLRHHHALLNRVSISSTHSALIQNFLFFSKSVKSFHLASTREVHSRHRIVVLYLVFDKKKKLRASWVPETM